MDLKINDEVLWMFPVDGPSEYVIVATKTQPHIREGFNESIYPNEGTDYVIVKKRYPADGNRLLPFHHVPKQHLTKHEQ